LRNVLWHHMESVGTKGYTRGEVSAMFNRFADVEVTPVATVYDRKWLGPLGPAVPDALGWNLCIRATR
ncbi:MAG TPA: hypothetical protein VE782_03235, partial [Myxococcaceae bacterium]|nr:hypothetical protein [Myxococcaceae bacterium]